MSSRSSSGRGSTSSRPSTRPTTRPQAEKRVLKGFNLQDLEIAEYQEGKIFLLVSVPNGERQKTKRVLIDSILNS